MTITLTKEQLFQAIERAIELGKYDIAHSLLDDAIKGYEAYKAPQEESN